MLEILKQKWSRWDGESWFGLLGWIGLLLLIVTLFRFFNADRMVRCYYLDSEATSIGPAYIVRADVDYADDLHSFKTADYKIAMEVFGQLPQCRK